ncbi:glycoside hydrolase [Flagelloscypha sp. PMI_526]|nr:glycoside hydrolase [Flagelloscypha sp. PMI_526]
MQSHLSLLLGFILHTLLYTCANAAHFPDKTYGVNLGSWLLIEPWMLPQEWVDMGGEFLTNQPCTVGIQSEFAFAQAYPDTVDEKMKGHCYGINLVRIPLVELGYWIVEDLVDRETEHYARGGIHELIFKLPVMAVVLDHHALPGVASPWQQFAGQCLPTAGFYTDANYHRALVWTAVMTTLTHIDPAFKDVVSIEAMNEPIMDASQTPGLPQFQKDFVKTVRAVEAGLGIFVDGSPFKKADISLTASVEVNTTAAFASVAASADVTGTNIAKVLLDAIPIVTKLAIELKLPINIFKGTNREPITTMQMDVSWQWGDSRGNPADAALGPQVYDNHLYYAFGGVADPNEEAYLHHICNLDRVPNDAALGNSPLLCGEWALPTQFANTDEFLRKWADAQKMAYVKGAGWVFWNFKIEKSELRGDYAREWAYYDGVERGYLTVDPAAYNDPDVCVPYKNQPAPTTTATSEVPTSTETASDASTSVTASDTPTTTKEAPTETIDTVASTETASATAARRRALKAYL